jgi:hypothetical protein
MRDAMSATMVSVDRTTTAKISEPREPNRDIGRRMRAVPVPSVEVDHVRLSCGVLGEKYEGMLEAWYRFLGSNPLVLYYFTQKSFDRPDAPAVRQAFAQWLVDGGNARTEQHGPDGHHDPASDWTRNPDGADRAILRYVLALLYPITAQQKEHQAWVKSVLQETFQLAGPAATTGAR